MVVKLVFWTFLSYGLTNIVVFGKIFSGFRNFLKFWGDKELRLPLNKIGNFLHELFICPMCFSFWGGIFLSLFFYSLSFHIFGVHRIISWFFDATYSSEIVWFINSIVEWFEENRIELNGSKISVKKINNDRVL